MWGEKKTHNERVKHAPVNRVAPVPIPSSFFLARQTGAAHGPGPASSPFWTLGACLQGMGAETKNTDPDFCSSLTAVEGILVSRICTILSQYCPSLGFQFLPGIKRIQLCIITEELSFLKQSTDQPFLLQCEASSLQQALGGWEKLVQSLFAFFFPLWEHFTCWVYMNLLSRKAYLGLQ